MRSRSKKTYMITTTTKSQIFNLKISKIHAVTDSSLWQLRISAPSRVNRGGTPRSPMRWATIALDNKGNYISPSSQFHHYGTKVETPARS